MQTDRPAVLQTVDFLKARTRIQPQVGFLTGTGLADTLEDFDIHQQFEYESLPNFPTSTVESHTGRLSFAILHNTPIMVMQGRFHLYEGYSPGQVTFPIRVMQEMGVNILILSNAAGGINLSFKAGDIMVIEDHINLTGANPLSGANQDCWGVRFPDMIQVYDQTLKKTALAAATELGITIQQGVYAGLAGPSLETPAETRYLKTIGSDAVGFSTVMEAIAATHAGMKILGLSLITNINNPDAPRKTTLEAVLETAGNASGRFSRLISEIVRQLQDHLFLSADASAGERNDP